MATIKAGTYRFNDVPTKPAFTGEIPLAFTTPKSNVTFDAEILPVLNGIISEKFPDAEPVTNTNYEASLSGAGFEIYEGFDYWIINILDAKANFVPHHGHEGVDAFLSVAFASGNEVYHSKYNTEFSGEWQIITIPNDTEVSAEFYEWFTANAVEQKQISGVWKFNDGVFCHPYETYRIGGSDYEGKIEFLKTHGALCEPIDLSSIQEGLYFNCFAMGNTYGDMFVNGEPTELDSGVFIGIYADEEYTGIGVVSVESLCGQTADFGTEPQYVSVDFYKWLVANAKQPSASVTYNGSVIAHLTAGQKATLNCAGKKMVGDIVITFDGDSGGNPADLIGFTIDDTDTTKTYEAEEGMTWEEWCVSEYNTDGWSVSGNLVIKEYGTYTVRDVTATDVIVGGMDYECIYV